MIYRYASQKILSIICAILSEPEAVPAAGHGALAAVALDVVRARQGEAAVQQDLQDLVVVLVRGQHLHHTSSVCVCTVDGVTRGVMSGV